MKMTPVSQGLWNTIESTDADVVTEEMNLQALSIICLSIEKCNFHHVKEVKTALEAWTCLMNVFEDDGLTRNVGLLCDLTSIALDDCETVEAYVDKVISIAHQLKSTDFAIPDKLLAGILLKGLPQTYKPMVMALESLNLELASHFVKSKILQGVKKDKSDSNAVC